MLKYLLISLCIICITNSNSNSTDIIKKNIIKNDINKDVINNDKYMSTNDFKEFIKSFNEYNNVNNLSDKQINGIKSLAETVSLVQHDSLVKNVNDDINCNNKFDEDTIMKKK